MTRGKGRGLPGAPRPSRAGTLRAEDVASDKSGSRSEAAVGRSVVVIGRSGFATGGLALNPASTQRTSSRP